MPYGMRIWDGSSNLILDTTDRITRFHSTISLGTINANSTVSYNVSGLAADGTWFLVFNTAGLGFIEVTITSNYLNFYNTQSYSINLTGVIVEIFRG